MSRRSTRLGAIKKKSVSRETEIEPNTRARKLERQLNVDKKRSASVPAVRRRRALSSGSRDESEEETSLNTPVNEEHVLAAHDGCSYRGKPGSHPEAGEQVLSEPGRVCRAGGEVSSDNLESDADVSIEWDSAYDKCRPL